MNKEKEITAEVISAIQNHEQRLIAIEKALFRLREAIKEGENEP